MPFLLNWETHQDIIDFYAEHGIVATVTPAPESPEGILYVVSSRGWAVVTPGQGFNLDGEQWQPERFQVVPADRVDFVVQETPES